MIAALSGSALRQLFRLYERLKTLDRRVHGRNQRYASAAPDGLPLPPATLRVRVAGTADIESFLDGGQKAAQAVSDLLAAGGRPIGQCRAILDFGCGCGRVLRQWKDLRGTALHGTDINPELVEWCREHLSFASMSVNRAEPPSSFAAGSFAAVYAFSIFTHMPAALQKQWLAEFRRILEPGGLLIFSTHGDYYLPRLATDERERFARGELVVRFQSVPGSNLCSTYHPEAFVRNELASGWEIAAFVPEGARGNPRQDAWVFRS